MQNVQLSINEQARCNLIVNNTSEVLIYLMLAKFFFLRLQYSQFYITIKIKQPFPNYFS